MRTFLLTAVLSLAVASTGCASKRRPVVSPVKPVEVQPYVLDVCNDGFLHPTQKCLIQTKVELSSNR